MYYSRTELALETCMRMMEKAEGKAKEMNVNVSIVIVDSSGNMKCCCRMDDSTNSSMDIALAKARHAINYRRSTKYHEDIVQGGGVAALAFPGIMPIEGGIPFVHGTEYVGAIGISGARSEQDGEIAAFGARMVNGDA